MFDALTSQSSRELCEQLRMVLEPTKASKLKGDFRTGRAMPHVWVWGCGVCVARSVHMWRYQWFDLFLDRSIYLRRKERCCVVRSGKRINLKKVIPYIASQYRWSTLGVPIEPLEYP